MRDTSIAPLPLWKQLPKMILSRIGATIAIVCTTTLAYGQTVNKAKLDSLLTAIEANNKGMGSLAISQNGKVVYSRAIGYRLLTERDKISSTIKTKYRIGSITKMYTAVMIMQLVEEGKLTLATPLSKYYPAMPNATKITIGHLLSHRSGLHNFTDDAGFLTWNEQPKSREEMLAIIANKGATDFEPDAKAEYSNSNYVLLGYILEKVCNKEYKVLLKERITDKLRLNDTYKGGITDPNRNEAYSYSYAGKWTKEGETDMSIPQGAGAIIATTTDLTQFIEALFEGRLVKPATLEQMMTLKDNFGLGMFQFPFGSKKAFGHNGGIDGFASMLGYFPKDKLAIAYCSNGTVWPINNVILGALTIYFNLPYTVPDFKEYAVAEADMALYPGVYSSTQIPLKITVSRQGSSLMAQATGQSAFPLEATAKDVFKYEEAGVVMEFNTAKKEMVLKQGAGVILFTKE